MVWSDEFLPTTGSVGIGVEMRYAPNLLPVLQNKETAASSKYWMCIALIHLNIGGMEEIILGLPWPTGLECQAFEGMSHGEVVQTPVLPCDFGKGNQP